MRMRLDIDVPGWSQMAESPCRKVVLKLAKESYENKIFLRMVRFLGRVLLRSKRSCALCVSPAVLRVQSLAPLANQQKGKTMNENKIIEKLEMIAQDMVDDAKNFDGKPFTGRTVAEYFGNQGAAIAALASIVKLLIESHKTPHVGDGALYCGVEKSDMIYYWRVRSRLPERFGQKCAVLVRGRMNSCLVQFEDGLKVLTSRNYVRRLPEVEVQNEFQFS